MIQYECACAHMCVKRECEYVCVCMCECMCVYACVCAHIHAYSISVHMRAWVPPHMHEWYAWVSAVNVHELLGAIVHYCACARNIAFMCALLCTYMCELLRTCIIVRVCMLAFIILTNTKDSYDAKESYNIGLLWWKRILQYYGTLQYQINHTKIFFHFLLLTNIFSIIDHQAFFYSDQAYLKRVSHSSPRWHFNANFSTFQLTPPS